MGVSVEIANASNDGGGLWPSTGAGNTTWRSVGISVTQYVCAYLVLAECVVFVFDYLCNADRGQMHRIARAAEGRAVGLLVGQLRSESFIRRSGGSGRQAETNVAVPSQNRFQR